MLNWIALNTIVACGIAVLATIVTLALRRRPAAGHVLWLCVLAALLAPPLPRHGALDGRAHAQRLAHRVEQGWTGLAPGSTGRRLQPDAGARPAQPSRPAVQPALPPRAGASLPPTDASQGGLEHAFLTWDTGGATDPHPAPVVMFDTIAGNEPVPDRLPRARDPWWASIDWRDTGARCALALWAFGAVIALGRLARDLLAIGRLRRGSSGPDADFAREVRAASDAFGIAPPRVCVSFAAETPLVCGLLRPTLVWPGSQALTAPGARAVLAHELAHLARRDHLVAWLEAVAACVLWWHPLAHLARAQLRRLAERSCDAWVVWAYPDARRDYADALLDAVERISFTRRPLPALGAVDSEKRTLARRLVMIMNGNVARRSSRALAVCAIALTAALSPTWATAAKRESPVSFAHPGDIDRALRPLVEAARLERLAGACAGSEEWDRAAEAYEELTSLRPDDAGAWHELAMALYHGERYGDAAKAFHRGAEAAAKVGSRLGMIGGVRVQKIARDAERLAKKELAVAAEQIALAAEERALVAEQLALVEEQRALAREQLAEAAEQAAEARAQLAEIEPELARLRAELQATGEALELEDLQETLDADWSADMAEALEALPPEDFEAEIAEELDQSMGDMDFSFDPGFDSSFDPSFDPGPALDSALGAWGPLSDWAYNEACCLALDGQEDAALDALERAIALDYESAEHAAGDSDLDSLHGSDRFEDLIVRMERLAELSEAGREACDSEEWDSAAEAFAGAVEIADRSADLQHMLAFASLRAGDAQAARDGWRRALDLGFDKPTGLYNLACAAAAAGEEDEALSALSDAVDAGFSDSDLIRDDPDLDPVRAEPGFDAILERVRARAEIIQQLDAADESGQWSEVAEMARSLLDEAPADSWEAVSARSHLGLALLRSGDYAGAETAFREAAVAGSGPANELYNIACCRALAGDEDGACDYLNAAVDAGYQDAEHMQADDDLASLRGGERFEGAAQRAADAQILEQFGAADWGHLLDRSRRQLEQDPDDGNACLMLGWALLRSGRAAEAIGAFEKQAELGYMPGIAHYNVACCHAVLGDSDAAFDALEEAVASGFGEFDLMADDPDLKSLRKDPRMKKLLKAHRGEDAAPEPPAPDPARNRI